MGCLAETVQDVCSAPDAPLSFEVISTLWRIGFLSRAIQAEQVAAARRERVSINNVHILLLLRFFGSVRPSDLSTQLFLTNAAITGCLDRLERDGLSERKASATDRRIRFVSLTAKGRETAERLFKGCVEDLAATRAISQLTPANRHQFNERLFLLVKELRSFDTI